MKEKKNELVIFTTQDGEVKLDVNMAEETVWLNRQQMAELFDRDVKTIAKHINNALHEELNNEVVVANFATTSMHGAVPGKTQTHMVEYFSLDVIISVGYRVKSQRGVEFRRWANSVLKEYILNKEEWRPMLINAVVGRNHWMHTRITSESRTRQRREAIIILDREYSLMRYHIFFKSFESVEISRLFSFAIITIYISLYPIITNYFV